MNKLNLSSKGLREKKYSENIIFLIIFFLFVPFFGLKASLNFSNKSITNDLDPDENLKEIRTYSPSDRVSLTITQQQKKKITGTITDVEGNPIIGANVIDESEKGNGTVTDTNGNFSLNIAENAVIRISYIGYLEQKINTTDKNIFIIILQEDTKALDEVVVVGYGTQKKVNLTGAIASMSSEDLSKVPTPNVSTLLYGQLPGLITLQRSGQPGLDNVALSIRGFSNALVVVDGVVGRDFSRLDPTEIENITILKDAASSAVYGVSGGNGVILVTTKKGNTGKPTFNYTMNYGVQHVTKYPRFVTSAEYAILKNEAAMNLGGEPVYSKEEIEKYRLGTDPDYPNFDYYDYMVRDYPPQFQQNITVRGGSESIKYFFLLGQTSQASMWKGGNQDYAKYNFRSNVDAQITNDFDVSVEFGARIEDRNNLIQDSYLMASWLQYSWPIFTPKNPDGTIASTNYGLTAYLDRDLTGYIKNKQNVYEGALTLNYKIPFVPGLSVNLKAALDMYYQDQKQWLKKYYTYTWNKETQTSTRVGSRGTDQLILDTWRSSFARIISSLNYERTFADVHNLKGLLLYEVSEGNATNFQASRINYVVPIDQIFAGPDAGKSNWGGASDDGRESYVGRLNYDFSGKYLFEYSFRYDGSAKFPPNKRWGFFSGVSAGWRISEEGFIKNNFNNLDNLKLRASWGNLGSDNTGNFQFLSGYTYPSGNYIYGGNTISGMIDTGTPNPNITWESSQIYDIGLDISLWNRQLEIETDVFYRKREGLLARRTTQLPSTFGATLPYENLNSDDARGFEIFVGHNSSIGEIKYRITSNLSWTRIKNKHLEQRDFNNQFDQWRNNSENRWNNLYWGYKAVGQFQSIDDIQASPIQDSRANSTLRPGDIKYEDFNKDGIVDGNDIQIIGRGQTPEITYGLGLMASWKRITFDMNWQGASLSNIQQQHFLIQPFANGMNAYAYFLDRWHRADPWNADSEWIPGKYPSTINDGAPNNKWNSSFWLLNATYFRLKLLSIGYSLENNLFKEWGIQNLVVSFSGQNLITLSKLGPIDPETPSGRLSYYPQQKTYNIGLNVTF
ncbi:SusC/RagA family TonB-linked outer membrane protein [Petrimonas sulfuriphila]|uniref:SusC/RagA family TonB-linked outer membrane protein n=2 Tax=Bacteria TaxID=2 RepID=UPI003EBC1405